MMSLESQVSGSTSLGSTYCDQLIVTILHPRCGGGRVLVSVRII